MTMQTATNGAVQDTPPPADPDAARYAELAKELSIAEGGEQEPAAPPEPTSSPEARAEARAEAQTEPKARPAHVPYAEHENVQKALREARDQERQSRDQLARFMRIVEEARGRGQPEPAKPEAPKLPDVQEDPIGHFTGKLAALEAQLNEARQSGQMTAEQLQADQQQRQFHAVVAQSEETILDPKNPSHKADYWEACRYLEDQRARELDTMYPSDQPHMLQLARQYGYPDALRMKLAILDHDRQAVAAQALQMGISPAEFYYSLAQNRGYQTPPAKPNGEAKGQQQIEALKRGMAASVSISGGAGERKGAKNMSITDLTAMFNEDPNAADAIFVQMAKAGLLG